jgi:hypothetical protein
VHYLGIWYHKDNRKGFLCSLLLPKPGSALVLTDTLNPLIYTLTCSHHNDGLHTYAFLTDLQILCSVPNIPKHLRDTQGCGCACKYVSLHKPFCSYVSISIQALVLFSSYLYGTQARVELCFIFYSIEGQHLAMWLSIALNSRCSSLSLQRMAIADVCCNAYISFFVVSLIYLSTCPFFILVH